MKKYLFVILIWLWLTMALLALFISRTPPFHFLELKLLVLFIESSKLLFIVIVFPLIISRLPLDTNAVIAGNGAAGDKRGNLACLLDCLKPLILFLLLSLPLTIMASYLGHADWGILLRANLLIMSMAILLALLFINLSEKHSFIYYLVVFMLYGVGPIFYYLVLEFTEASWSILFQLNPFWLFWQINNPEAFNPAWLVQCLGWVVLIIITLVINNKILKGKQR